MPPSKCVTVVNEGSKDILDHRVFKVELKDGNNYAFDVTSAQFGMRMMVKPWFYYAETLSLKVLERYPIGWHSAMKAAEPHRIQQMRASS